MNSASRIAMAAAVVVLGVGLWAATERFHGADGLGEVEAAEAQSRDRPVSVSPRASAWQAKPTESAAPSVSLAPRPPTGAEEYWLMRQAAEARLDRQGQRARRQLAERQVARLHALAEQAERNGNAERARLMRARVTYLEGQASEDPPEE